MRVEVRFTCPLKNGVHARPASVLAEVARRYASRVTIGRADAGAKSRLEVDARSVLSVVGLDITLGEACLMVAEGEDAEAAAKELRGLVDRAWLETDELPAAIARGGTRPELPIGIRGTGVTYVTGVPACGGIGIGKAVVVSGPRLSRELMEARAESAEEEMEAVERALDAVSRELRQRSEEARGQFEGELLRAHAGIVEDPALRAELEGLVRRGATALQAVVRASEKFSAALSSAGSAYVRDRAVDVQDVCGQVLEELTATVAPPKHGETGGTVALTEGSVIIADVLTANQLMKMDASKVKALVLGSVGATAHTVILARSMRIPTVLEARRGGRRGWRRWICAEGVAGSAPVLPAERPDGGAAPGGPGADRKETGGDT
jgi:multiphosphoryl transfer protein